MFSPQVHRVALYIAAITLICGGAKVVCAAEDSTTVVAKQGAAVVTLGDIDTFAEGIPEEQRAGFFDSSKRVEGVISNLLLKKQLAAEARTLGLEKEPMVKAQIAAAEDDVLSKVRMARLKVDTKVPDLTQLAKETYLGNKTKYISYGKLDVKHILISTKSRSEAEARKLAEKVEKEAKADPAKFDALVEEYSEDPSKDRNQGLMANAGGNQYQPPFAEASRALKNAGDISPIVQTSYGFHIIKLIERTPDRQQSFDEVREGIVAKLKADYVDKAVRGHTDEITNRPIDANPEVVGNLRSRYGEVPKPPALDSQQGAN